MSEPKRHHYLPQSYLERWTVAGEVQAYTRPRGPSGSLHIARKPPRSVAFEYSLYTHPSGGTAAEKQRLELDYLQKIDDVAARALASLTSGKPRTPKLATGLCQFVLSLQFRTPARLEWLQSELLRRVGIDQCEDGDKDLVRGMSLDLFADIVSSATSIGKMCELPAWRLEVEPDCKFTLLTSDCPVLMSNGPMEDEGFIILPYSPRDLLILAKQERVVKGFAELSGKELVGTINDGVVCQAKHMVIGCSDQHRRFVDKRFLRSAEEIAPHVGPDGLLRWESPF